MAQDPVQKQIERDIGKGLDDAIDALRWARRRVQERNAAEIVRLVQLNLSSISLALDWQMQGETEKAMAAVDRFWWQPHKDDSRPRDITPTGH